MFFPEGLENTPYKTNKHESRWLKLNSPLAHSSMYFRPTETEPVEECCPCEDEVDHHGGGKILFF